MRAVVTVIGRDSIGIIADVSAMCSKFGANIIDTTLILPLCAVINGEALPVDRVNLVFDFPICIAACAVGVVPTIIQGKFRKWQGYALLGIYALYMIFLILNETKVITLG